jgi:hypothetical protein
MTKRETAKFNEALAALETLHGAAPKRELALQDDDELVLTIGEIVMRFDEAFSDPKEFAEEILEVVSTHLNS